MLYQKSHIILYDYTYIKVNMNNSNYSVSVVYNHYCIITKENCWYVNEHVYIWYTFFCYTPNIILIKIINLYFSLEKIDIF